MCALRKSPGKAYPGSGNASKTLNSALSSLSVSSSKNGRACISGSSRLSSSESHIEKSRSSEHTCRAYVDEHSESRLCTRLSAAEQVSLSVFGWSWPLLGINRRSVLLLGAG